MWSVVIAFLSLIAIPITRVHPHAARVVLFFAILASLSIISLSVSREPSITTFTLMLTKTLCPIVSSTHPVAFNTRIWIIMTVIFLFIISLLAMPGMFARGVLLYSMTRAKGFLAHFTQIEIMLRQKVLTDSIC